MRNRYGVDKGKGGKNYLLVLIEREGRDWWLEKKKRRKRRRKEKKEKEKRGGKEGYYS